MLPRSPSLLLLLRFPSPLDSRADLTRRNPQKPTDLPDKIHDNPPPIPNSANKDHLDVSNGGAGKKSSSSYAGSSGDDAADVDDAGGVIQPLHSFFLSLTMILFSEVGDKTFLVAAADGHEARPAGGVLGRLQRPDHHDRAVGRAGPRRAHADPQAPDQLPGRRALPGLRRPHAARGPGHEPRRGRHPPQMQEVELELAEKEQHMAREKGRQHRGLRPASTDTADVSPYSLEMGLGPGPPPALQVALPLGPIAGPQPVDVARPQPARQRRPPR